jgi:hypothetical protein
MDWAFVIQGVYRAVPLLKVPSWDFNHLIKVRGRGEGEMGG